MTDLGLRHLANLRALRVLEVHHTNVTEAGIAGFRQMARGCWVRSDFGLLPPYDQATDEPPGLFPPAHLR